MNKRINLSLIFALSINFCVAQTNFGSRLSSMGNNGAAVKDIWSNEANPAGITGIDATTISINYLKYLVDSEISKQGVSFVLPITNNFIGLSFQRYGISEYNEIKAGFVVAKKFGDHFALSLRGNYHQIKISNYGATTGFSVDVGTMYSFNDKFTLGFYVNNPSLQKYTTKALKITIPTIIYLGAAYHISDKVLIASTISKAAKAKMDLSVGIDYKAINLLSLRAGLSAKPFKHYAGFGLNYKKIMLDFAVENDPNLDYTLQMALAYAF